MQAVLPCIASYGRAFSLSPIAARSFSTFLRSGCRVVQKHRTIAPTWQSLTISKWQQQTRLSSSSPKARKISEQDPEEELSEFERDIEAEKEKQTRTPWHREGADQAPVSRPRSAGAMTRGNTFISQCCVVNETKLRQASF